MFDRIEFSPHAEQRLAERPEVSRAMVEETIRRAEQRFADPRNPTRWIAHRRFERSRGPVLVRVFYIQHADGRAEVVSFYRTPRIERYWRADR